MVSFLFHSKGNAPLVNQKSIIQNHLFLMVLLEKMRDVVTRVAIVGMRGPSGCRSGWVQVGMGEAAAGPPPARLQSQGGRHITPKGSLRLLFHTLLSPCQAQSCPKLKGRIPALSLLPRGQIYHLRLTPFYNSSRFPQ